ncbi:MAG: septum formation initiator family protein [Bacteroidota bacterium]
MTFFNYIPSFLKNKYLLTLVGFAVWMLFFDDRAFYVTVLKQRHELSELQKSKQYYQHQISDTQKELDQLKINAFTIEKYAREKYLMKRDNEDLFIVEPTKEAN